MSDYVDIWGWLLVIGGVLGIGAFMVGGMALLVGTIVAAERKYMYRELRKMRGQRQRERAKRKRHY